MIGVDSGGDDGLSVDKDEDKLKGIRFLLLVPSISRTGTPTFL